MSIYGVHILLQILCTIFYKFHLSSFHIPSFSLILTDKGPPDGLGSSVESEPSQQLSSDQIQRLTIELVLFNGFCKTNTHNIDYSSLDDIINNLYF